MKKLLLTFIITSFSISGFADTRPIYGVLVDDINTSKSCFIGMDSENQSFQQVGLVHFKEDQVVLMDDCLTSRRKGNSSVVKITQIKGKDQEVIIGGVVAGHRIEFDVECSEIENSKDFFAKLDSLKRNHFEACF